MPDSAPPGVAETAGADAAALSQRELVRGFRRAAALRPDLIHESSYRMSGRRVTLRLLGHRIGAALPRALAHLP